MKQTFFLVHDQARKLAQEAIRLAPDGYCVEVKQSTRTLEQNSRMWALLSDISRQVDWHGRKLSPEEWKSVFTAALKKQDVVPNIDGTGFVVLGLSTSKMTKSEMADLQTLMEAFGANHGVRFSEYE